MSLTKVLEITASHQLQAENRRKDVGRFLDILDPSEVRHIVAIHCPFTNDELKERILAMDDGKIAELHNREQLYQEPFDEDEL